MLTMNYKALNEQYGKPKHKKKKQTPVKTKKTYTNYWTYLESTDTPRTASKPSKQPKGTDTKVEYKKQLREAKWLRKRTNILRRDNNMCVLCGSNFNLQVHHTVYREGKKAWEYPNHTLVTLCDNCHKKVHQDPEHKLYPQYEK